jgi:hypothetical protein
MIGFYSYNKRETQLNRSFYLYCIIYLGGDYYRFDVAAVGCIVLLYKEM